MRHIIVEGMDGTGKSNLVQAIMESHLAKRFALHERASTSIGGPVDDLEGWVEKDINEMGTSAQSYIYDRHPLISELIYGPICRGQVPGNFNNQQWVESRKQILRHWCVVIWCTPAWTTVKNNLIGTAGNHMQGVVDNARHLYYVYNVTADLWPGASIRYDYTRLTKAAMVDYIEMVVPPHGR